MLERHIKKGDKSCLEKEFTVKIDRPIGAAHPKHPDIIYPINYGYVPNLIAGDGEEQDVYILGVDKPIDEIKAVIVAVIERSDDDEDKWVGVPKELVGTPVCFECSINKAVEFQEQFYTHKCTAVYEKTCGAVMFTETSGERRYLLIKNDSGHIGFPKGHVEYGETEEETAVREVFEETGLKAELMENFRVPYSYISNTGHHKTAVYFLSHYDNTEIHIRQGEISDSWLLPYDKAYEMLNYPQDRAVIEAAENRLRSADRV
ncbi:MAG: NUDIX domain-containing protein [Oscillospiraceae bacterium]|nr:NUDIX domain-containing protein [Oscillospiraceae bacterium]